MKKDDWQSAYEFYKRAKELYEEQGNTAMQMKAYHSLADVSYKVRIKEHTALPFIPYPFEKFPRATYFFGFDSFHKSKFLYSDQCNSVKPEFEYVLKPKGFEN